MRLFRSARLLLLALLVILVPASSFAGVFISVNFGPPVLPVYEQPICPQPDLIWTPGYWAYGDDGYFWVPGAWVPAPFVGGLWTPGYWGWSSGNYLFHPGYWGYHVGYYGGVNYGGGYLGIGFAGGEWRGGHMAYNTAVVNVNTTIIHTTYINRTVIETNTVENRNHVAYSGGPGGIQHQAAPEERLAERESHTPPTTFQSQHIQAAQTNKLSYAKANGGHPSTLAVAKPLPVEAHPAPARTPAAVGAGRTPQAPTRNEVSPSTAHPGTVAPRSPEPNRTYTPPQNTSQPRPSTEPRSNPQPRPNSEPRPNAEPRSNPEPRSAPKPPPSKPAPKSKPEGR